MYLALQGLPDVARAKTNKLPDALRNRLGDHALRPADGHREVEA